MTSNIMHLCNCVMEKGLLVGVGWGGGGPAAWCVVQLKRKAKSKKSKTNNFIYPRYCHWRL